MKLTYLENEKIHIEPQDKTELRGIKSWFDRYVDGYMFDPLFKNKLWNGKKTEFDNTTSTIPMGLWKEVFKCCEEFGYSFNFVNKKEFPINRDVKEVQFKKIIMDFFKGYQINGVDFIPRDYQLRVAFNIIKSRYCNIAVATSGGKTLIYTLVLIYLMKTNPDSKFLLIVPSKTLVTQFYNDLINFNWNNELDLNVQEIFDATEKPRHTDPSKDANLVIGTFQSLSGKNVETNKPKYPKLWFQKFYSITCDEGHRSQNKSYKKILKYTANNAYYRWGMSGSFPVDESYEMMSIMSKTGPVVDIVKARELMDNGYITSVKIKQILLQHNNFDFAKTLEIVASRDKKSAYDLEVEKIQESNERLNVINQIVSKCKSNTLVLFHNTEYGQRIMNFLKESNPDKDFFYIDGSVKENGTKKNPEKSRKWIKEQMEKTKKNVEYTVLVFDEYEIEVKSDYNILLSNKEFKLAKDITETDDIDDDFILKLKSQL